VVVVRVTVAAQVVAGLEQVQGFLFLAHTQLP
jgi:hypothetical protein